MFCGWDWGSTVHGVCLIDDEGAVIKRWMVAHTEDQLMKVFTELAELAELTELTELAELAELVEDGDVVRLTRGVYTADSPGSRGGGVVKLGRDRRPAPA